LPGLEILPLHADSRRAKPPPSDYWSHGAASIRIATNGHRHPSPLFFRGPPRGPIPAPEDVLAAQDPCRRSSSHIAVSLRRTRTRAGGMISVVSMSERKSGPETETLPDGRGDTRSAGTCSGTGRTANNRANKPAHGLHRVARRYGRPMSTPTLTAKRDTTRDSNTSRDETSLTLDQASSNRPAVGAERAAAERIFAG